VRGEEAVLHAGAFASSLDRFATAPLVVPVAAAFGVSLASVLGVVAAYLVAYGVTQPVWGMLSDRFGRVRVLRGALGLAAVSGALSAAATGLGSLTVARTLCGAAMGGVIPTILVRVGDTKELSSRHRTLASLIGTIATATCVATAGAALLGAAGLWRLAFAITAALAVLTALATRRLREGDPPIMDAARPWRAFGRALASPVVWPVLLVAMLEGGIVPGVLAILPTVAQAGSGLSSAVGAVVASYGIALIAGSWAAQALARSMPPTGLVLTGGATMIASQALLVAAHSPLAVLVASGLLGLGWAPLHSTVQTWATEVLPSARAAVISMFATSLFSASAATAILVGPWVEALRFRELFTVTTAVTVVMVAYAAVSLRRFSSMRRRRAAGGGAVSRSAGGGIG
jgi:predicted MFS family arabinose efflux permease